MIKDVANRIKAVLNESFFENDGTGIITHLSGLVRTKELKPIEGEKEKKKIPFPLEDEDIEDCGEQFSIHKLVPDETKRCIVYFEGENSKFVQSLGDKTNWTTNLNLICWYNSSLFEEQDLLQSRLISLFSSVVKSVKTKDDVLAIKNIELLTVSESTNIFSKYTYSDMISNYLLHPFGYFSITFKINFTTNEKTDCLPSIATLPNQSIC